MTRNTIRDVVAWNTGDCSVIRRVVRVMVSFSVVLLSAISHGADKPNIIFILADDLAQGDLGCYGQKLILTPNLDRMAAEGTRYTQAYCGTSVCAPSRTSLMTGLHCGHAPFRGNKKPPARPKDRWPLPAETLTVAQVLKTQRLCHGLHGQVGHGHSSTPPAARSRRASITSTATTASRQAHNYFPPYLHNDDQPHRPGRQDLRAGSHPTGRTQLGPEAEGRPLLSLLCRHTAAWQVRDR